MNQQSQLSLVLSEVKQEVDAADSVAAPVTLDQILSIPFLRDGFKAIPTAVARSGAFSSSNEVANKESDFMNNVTLYRDDNIVVKFSGHLLNQSDADIWMQVIALMKNKKLGTDGRIKARRSEFMRMLGWDVAGPNYEKLLNSFKRLVESTFYLESPDEDASDSKKSKPLRMFEYTQEDGFITVWIPSESMALFSRMSEVNWDARLKLGNRMDLAKAVQIYASSFTPGHIHTISLGDLKSITGHKSPDRKFAIILERALNKLQDLNVLSNVWVSKELGVWYCGWTLPQDKPEISDV